MAQPVEPVVTTCYRHPKRRAGVSCQRCDRPICPDCMVQASVGFHCPECTKTAAKNSPVITARSFEVQPIVTQVLIALNVAAFLAVLATGGSVIDGGGRLSDSTTLISFNSYALHPTMAHDGVAGGEWYRLVTSGFLHYGIIHLGLNMVVLWLVGAQLEKAIGHARYVALYFVALLAGSFAVLMFSPDVAAAGASGAIFGLLGAMFAYQRDRGINPVQSGLVGLIVINIAFTFLGHNISIAAHIGGLVAGFAAGWMMFQLERRANNVWAGVVACAVIGWILAIAGVWAAHRDLLNYAATAVGR